MLLTMLKGAKDTAVNKTDKHPCPHGAYILVGKMDNNQKINVCKMYSIL